MFFPMYSSHTGKRWEDKPHTFFFSRPLRGESLKLANRELHREKSSVSCVRRKMLPFQLVLPMSLVMCHLAYLIVEMLVNYAVWEINSFIAVQKSKTKNWSERKKYYI